MQCVEERHERSRFCGTQVFSVSRHIAAALYHLPDQLIMRESHGDCIERRSALPTLTVERVAVVTLLGLKDQRALAFQSRVLHQVFRWNGFTAPCVHHWTPGRVASELRERSDRDSRQHNDKNRHGAASPALL